ncbi:MAG: hypothetical protein JW850_15355 [Thermoflexales bacterium]|nr:hypothetical protein [Thermoflexales bacterium]
MRYSAYLGLGLISAAALAFEVALVRLFSLAQFYHFAFLSISLALLGSAASGSLLAAFPALKRSLSPIRLGWLALAASFSMMVSYALANTLPFDSFTLAWDRRQLLYLLALYLGLALPFLLGGLVVAWPLAARPQAAHRFYAANLAGSAAGCLFAPLALGNTPGIQGTFALCALAAALAALLLCNSRLETGSSDQVSVREAWTRPADFGLLFLIITAIAMTSVAELPSPPFVPVRLSPYKQLSQALNQPGVSLHWSRWNAYSRVDTISGSSLRSLPGLSFAYTGELPPQDGLTFDGDDLSPITHASPEEAGFAAALPGRVAYDLRPGASVLVLDARGGLDVLAALAGGAASVTAVEPNPLAVEAVRWTGSLYDDPHVGVLNESVRGYVRRSSQGYDVVVLSLAAAYRPVTSGAYSLAEDYTLTQEAFDDYVAQLEEGGLLVVTRWLQEPPSEELRAFGLALNAARRAGLDPGRSLIALRGYRTMTVVLKRGAFEAGELEQVRAFAARHKFDLAAAPGLEAGQANRYNVLIDDAYFRTFSQLSSSPDPLRILADYPFDVTPPTDDRPFFGHYFRWSQAGHVLAQIGHTWQPFGGAGYFVLAALLGLVTVAAGLLIVLPLVKIAGAAQERPKPGGDARVRTLIYFGALGLGFMGVEIPLVQRFILLLERPVYAISAVVFGLLLFSGLGSWASRRVPLRAALGGLAGLALVYPWVVEALTRAALGWPLGARFGLSVLGLAPLGFLMGVPFPAGLARLERASPELIPWAWAINGALSVIASVGAAMLALSAGFSAVLLAGAACYGAALVASGITDL